jgi:hypothetical protein
MFSILFLAVVFCHELRALRGVALWALFRGLRAWKAGRWFVVFSGV